jgi:hypothetical protein
MTNQYLVYRPFCDVGSLVLANITKFFAYTRSGACKDLRQKVSNSGGKPRESLAEAAVAVGTDSQLFRQARDARMECRESLPTRM